MREIMDEFILRAETKKFGPRPYYSPEGDFIAVFFEDEDHYAVSGSDPLTLYVSTNDHRVVGCKINGVRRIMGEESVGPDES
jgi:hypothetical protein